MKFCYVILHYKTDIDTIECIESIQRQKEECEIVVVDNHSDNGSIEKVESRFEGLDNVHFIKNKENLGFAEGNNVGYAYAKNILDADFIAISNNDIIVDSPNFIDKVRLIYERTDFHVLGPDIESLKDHGHQNPMKRPLLSKRETVKEIWRYRLLYFLSRIYIYDFIKNAKSTILKQDSNPEQQIPRPMELCKESQNRILHGSFVVFSPAYIKNEDLGFRPGTFLYMEEYILFQYCKAKGYTTLYSPDVKVFHKEDSSTNSLFSKNKQKREFVFKNMIRSLKVYLRIMRTGADREEKN